MKKEKLRWSRIVLAASCFAFSAFLASCSDSDDGKIVPHNPSGPITITSFSPDTARVATQMLIHGKNFGGEKDKITVEINGRNAAVIGVNPEGTLIYCIVPSMSGYGGSHEAGDKIVATAKVIVGESESEFSFDYIFSQNVSTLLGFTDQDGNTAIVDGPFDKAQFQSPFWLAFDHNKDVYLIEENNGMRFIDMHNKEVSTVFRTGNGVGRPRTITFTLKNMVRNSIGDTMIVANDAGAWTDIGTIILIRDTLSGRFLSPWKAVQYHKQCNGGVVHPVSGEYWFNSYEQSQVYKTKSMTGDTWTWGSTVGDGKDNYYFKVQDTNWEFNIQIAPSGDFAYIVSKNQHYIAKMTYDYAGKKFNVPTPFAGQKQKSGFKDGVGTAAMFREPQQGAFDKDDNFYVCDGENNCIRKVTPGGQVSTYAGRPENPGYSDGALRDAQFDAPFGIIYDDEINTFYVADRDNRRIRTIKVE
ncbi:MAG: IPT/TIG domain-containing protein [Prevotella sp.]|jgi:hypothetical protein|nr:IPT/TIG domain-containing protein [Prevotella sp.]